jgi:integrase
MRAWAAMLGTSRILGTIDRLIDIYVRDKLPSLAPRTQTDYLVAIALLRPVFGHMTPADLEPKHVYAYMHARKSRARANVDDRAPVRQAKTRANREIATLSAVMQYGVELGEISVNPCRSVKRAKESPRKRYVNDLEVQQLLAHCPAWLKLFIELKLHTGLRQGDLLALRLDAIRSDGLFVRTGKTGREILFGWTDELRATIEGIRNLRRRVSSLHLFPSRDATPLTQRGFKSAWARAMKLATAEDADPRLMERFAEHDLRAKVGTDAHDRGQNATDLLGHENPQTTRRTYIRGVLKVEPLRKDIRQK